MSNSLKNQTLILLLVAQTGVEPVCPRGRLILSQVRLPIPTLGHDSKPINNTIKSVKLK